MSRLLHLLPSRRGVLLSVAVLLTFAFADPVRAEETPTAVVQGFYAALLDVMKNSKALGYKGRYDKLKPAFEKAFDADFMTRFVAAAKWNELNDGQKKRLVDVFSAFSVASYARNFNAFDSEVFEVGGARDIPQGTMVSSRIVPKDDAPVPMNYLLRQNAGNWKIIDVFLDGTISQLATRRTDFASALRDGGVPALIQLLETKTKEMAEGA